MPLKSPLIILYICLYIYIHIVLHSVHTILKYPQDTETGLNEYASIIQSFSTCKLYDQSNIKAVNSKKKKQPRRKDFTVASFHPQGRHSPDQPDLLIQTKQEQGHRLQMYESKKKHLKIGDSPCQLSRISR